MEKPLCLGKGPKLGSQADGPGHNISSGHWAFELPSLPLTPPPACPPTLSTKKVETWGLDVGSPVTSEVGGCIQGLLEPPVLHWHLLHLEAVEVFMGVSGVSKSHGQVSSTPEPFALADTHTPLALVLSAGCEDNSVLRG